MAIAEPVLISALVGGAVAYLARRFYTRFLRPSSARTGPQASDSSASGAQACSGCGSQGGKA